jgi:D-beta-D-heptose 7-phosphate kinase/D-beta-D-heptose 1-phosphate adenosyltransferase
MSEIFTYTGDNKDSCRFLHKIKQKEQLKTILLEHQRDGKKIAFTNGCFDLLHVGHVRYLSAAKSLADILVVAVNSDESVREIKGEKKPIVLQDERTQVLAALEFVDYVVIFDEPDPYELIYELISYLSPDVLIKGADWGHEDIVGRDIVEKSGGKIVRIELTKGASTSNIIDKILKMYKQVES